MAHPFLSDEWIEAAQAVYERYRGDLTALEAARIDLTVTAVPFGSGTIEAHVDTSSGVLELALGHLGDTKVSITVDYPTARALFVDQDPGAAMQAFLSGKVVVQGDMTELLRLQTVLGATKLQGAAAEVKALTAEAPAS